MGRNTIGPSIPGHLGETVHGSPAQPDLMQIVRATGVWSGLAHWPSSQYFLGASCVLIQQTLLGDFSGGPVVKTLHSHLQGAQVQSLVGELRSHMLPDVAKKVKNNKSNNNNKHMLLAMSQAKF